MDNKKAGENLAVKGSSEIKQYGEPRLPGKPLYYSAGFVLKTYVKLLYRVKFDKSAVTWIKERYGKKTPYVVLSNHCSTLDWIYVATNFLPDTLNFVVTTYYFSKPGLRGMLKNVGAIAKDQFSPDVHSVKTILKTAKMGGNIMIFPEGRTTPSGTSETFERSTVKLLKHLKSPVVALKINGAYLTNPKWSSICRRGRVDITSKVLFTPEDLEKLSDDEIYGRMCRALRTDEYEWQKKNYVEYKSKHFAKGLENVLWKCPKCGAEFRNTTSDHSLTCLECNNKIRVNSYYDLIPFKEAVCFDNIAQWYDWEVETIKQAIEEDDSISMREHVELSQIIDTKKWLEPVGDGTATINREGFFYSGTRLGEEYELFIPINMLPAAAVGPGKSFELYYKGDFYSFAPDNAAASQKWSNFIEQMHDHVMGK